MSEMFQTTDNGKKTGVQENMMNSGSIEEDTINWTGVKVQWGGDGRFPGSDGQAKFQLSTHFEKKRKKKERWKLELVL